MFLEHLSGAPERFRATNRSSNSLMLPHMAAAQPARWRPQSKTPGRHPEAMFGLHIFKGYQGAMPGPGCLRSFRNTAILLRKIGPMFSTILT